MEKSLESKVAIVTGASRGIGLTILKRLAEEGANVVNADRDLSKMDEIKKSIESLGVKVVGIPIDVTKRGDVDRMVKQVLEKLGKIDILVNNAGIIGRYTPIQEISEAEWDAVLEVDLKGVFLCSQAAIKHMIERRTGNIVNIASIAGKEGNPNMVHYCAAKGGVITFTKALAQEVVTHGIRVNCVSPVIVEDTEMTKGMSIEQQEMMTSKIPMGRLVKKEEVASVVNFLVSDESSFITGQCVNICGGRGKY